VQYIIFLCACIVCKMDQARVDGIQYEIAFQSILYAEQNRFGCHQAKYSPFHIVGYLLNERVDNLLIMCRQSIIMDVFLDLYLYV